MTNESITINLDNLMKKVLPEQVIKALDDVCLTIIQDAQKRFPKESKNEEGGRIRESLGYAITEENGVFTGRVGSNNEIAIYVHEGTGLYAIEGNGRKDVPWSYQDRKGNWHTTSGMHPNQFLREAIEENRDYILENFEEILTDD